MEISSGDVSEHTDRHLLLFASDLQRMIAQERAQRPAPEYDQRVEIGFEFLLHDIGKVGIPESVRNEPGPLTADEWAIMRTHPLIGVEPLTPLRFLGDGPSITGTVRGAG